MWGNFVIPGEREGWVYVPTVYRFLGVNAGLASYEVEMTGQMLGRGCTTTADLDREVQLFSEWSAEERERRAKGGPPI